MVIRFPQKMRSTYKTAEVIFISYLVFVHAKLKKNSEIDNYLGAL